MNDDEINQNNKSGSSDKTEGNDANSEAFSDQPVPDMPVKITPEFLKQDPIKISPKKKTNSLFYIVALLVAFLLIFGMSALIQNINKSSQTLNNAKQKRSSQSDKALTNSENELNPTGSDGTNGGGSSSNPNLKYCSNAITATIAC